MQNQKSHLTIVVGNRMTSSAFLWQSSPKNGTHQICPSLLYHGSACFVYKSQTSCHLKPWEQINWHFPKQSPANGELVVWDLLYNDTPLRQQSHEHFRGSQESKPPGPKPLIYHYVTQKERKRQLTIGLLDFMFEPSKSEKKSRRISI